MKTLLTAVVAAVVLCPFAPAARAAAKPAPKRPRLLTKRFPLEHCDPADARLVFEAVAALAGPILTVPGPGEMPAGAPVPAAFPFPAAPAPVAPPAPAVFGVLAAPAAAPDTTCQPAGPAAPPARPATLRVVVDLKARALVVRGTEKDLEFAGDLVAVLDAPEDKPVPATKEVRAFRTRRDAAEVFRMLSGLDAEPEYRAPACGRMKLIVAVGPAEALEDLADTLKELDVPVK